MFETAVGVWLTNINIAGGFWQIALNGCFDVHISNVAAAFGEVTEAGEIGVVVSVSTYTGAYGGNIFIDNCAFRTASGASGSAGARYGIEVVTVDGLFVTNSYFGYFKNSAAYLFNALAGVFLAGVKFNNCWFDNYDGIGVTLEGGVSANFSNIDFIGCSFLGGHNAVSNLVVVSGNPNFVKLRGAISRQ
ncbi:MULTISPECIES: hypothetical protein [unclassified Rhizobium]|uniref:hypothetical protein n=1 Tax=unclassified Rhizobium TaxID=2613769 RepID=UPI0013C4EB29|nr:MULTISPECIES: hypothetical protein [unclassified Rhizobium]